MLPPNSASLGAPAPARGSSPADVIARSPYARRVLRGRAGWPRRARVDAHHARALRALFRAVVVLPPRLAEVEWRAADFFAAVFLAPVFFAPVFFAPRFFAA